MRNRRAAARPALRLPTPSGPASGRPEDGLQPEARGAKSGARPERQGLFADQTVEIEGALVARRRGPHGADSGEQQHECRCRNTEERPDRVADPVEVAERDALRIGREHLPIRQVVAVREMPDQAIS
jgi:hypothetical protein